MTPEERATLKQLIKNIKSCYNKKGEIIPKRGGFIGLGAREGKEGKLDGYIADLVEFCSSGESNGSGHFTSSINSVATELARQDITVAEDSLEGKKRKNRTENFKIKFVEQCGKVKVDQELITSLSDQIDKTLNASLRRQSTVEMASSPVYLPPQEQVEVALHNAVDNDLNERGLERRDSGDQAVNAQSSAYGLPITTASVQPNARSPQSEDGTYYDADALAQNTGTYYDADERYAGYTPPGTEIPIYATALSDYQVAKRDEFSDIFNDYCRGSGGVDLKADLLTNGSHVISGGGHGNVTVRSNVGGRLILQDDDLNAVPMTDDGAGIYKATGFTPGESSSDMELETYELEALGEMIGAVNARINSLKQERETAAQDNGNLYNIIVEDEDRVIASQGGVEYNIFIDDERAPPLPEKEAGKGNVNLDQIEVINKKGGRFNVPASESFKLKSPQRDRAGTWVERAGGGLERKSAAKFVDQVNDSRGNDQGNKGGVSMA